jgi:trehalose-phosphatase
LTATPSRLRSELLAREKGKSPLFFFDFDGTLTEIERTPDGVKFKPIARFIVEELSRHFSVGIITGRALPDIKKLIGIKGIYYSGNHGVEIEGPRLRFVEKNSAKSVAYLNTLIPKLKRKLKPYGPIIQHKKYSIAVHYRTVEARLVRQLLDDLDLITSEPVRSGKVRLQLGKKVVEIKAPVEWDKGKAIERILMKTGRTGKVFFFGDDMTDEFGFEMVNSLKGVSVYVGGLERETHARYYLESPTALIGELAKFLFELE